MTRTRRTLVAAAVAVLVTAPSAAPALAAAGPSPAAAALLSLPVDVDVDFVSPSWLAPGGTLSMSGAVSLGLGASWTEVGVRLRVDTVPLRTRRALDVALGLPDDVAVGTVPDSSVVDLSATPGGGMLFAGANLDWSLSMPADDLGFTDSGVYAVTVEARGVDATGARETIGATRTFLVWQTPESPIPPMSLTWLVPLTAAPTIDAEGDPVPEQSAELAGALAAGGRLDRMLTSWPQGSATFLVDPDLLSQASRFGADGRSWVARVGERARAGDVRLLPFADPDLVAATDGSRTATVLQAQLEGTEATAQLLGVDVAPGPWLPGNGAVTRTLTRSLEGATDSSVVISTGQVLGVNAIRPGPLVDDSGSGLTLLLSDDRLAEVADAGVAADGVALARQRLLAETAVLAGARHGQRLAVTVAREWDPTSAWLTTVATLPDVAPWTTRLSLADAEAGAVGAPVLLRPYPLEAAQEEIPQDRVNQLADAVDDVGSFSQVVSDSAAFFAPWRRTEMRGLSTAWRTDPTAGQQYVDGVTAAAARQTSQVALEQRSTVTLSSREGRIPMTVRNDLAVEATVSVRLAADPAYQLRSDPSALTTISPGRTTSIEIAATTLVKGPIEVEAQLLSPDGVPVGESVRFVIDARGYDRVAQIVLGSMAVLLVATLAYRLTRRIRRGPRRLRT